MLQFAVRLGLLVLLVAWCFILVRPFIPILAWSVVLAVALYPLYSWLADRLGKRPKLAAAIVTAISLAVMIGPVTWIGFGLADGAKYLTEQLSAGGFQVPSPPARIRDWPLIGERLFDVWSTASSNIEALAQPLLPHIKSLLRSVVAMLGSVGFGALKFLAAIILAGFLFPSGPGLVETSRRIMARILPQRSEDLLALAGATIRSVSQGVIGIALLQAILIGIGLKFIGMASAGLLAFAVMILSILQLGAAIVLLPCLVWIWMTKEFAIALLITVYLVVVGLADNVLKPLLMGRGLTTPMPVIFIGLLGGTIAHGLVGLFIGPIILAVGWQIMMAWIRDDERQERVARAARVSAEA
ncbi:AI-2E family transporter [Bradyrhizobium sp. STM 3843]|uniref:AI-2E family transporter n=1 Tax=Bradyrhizobium sp. STM 3843 TaxID=551947 RepID=UPI001FCBA02D|nr:AI-2E family transporter [Bradyrhizobium sp. STM 3843]